MELQTAIEILEYHQEWRLGKREDMIHEPKKLTQALDIVLSDVKNADKEDILIEFQIYLNDQKLINNHDWDFEKEAKKFIKQKKHEPNKPTRPNPFFS